MTAPPETPLGGFRIVERTSSLAGGYAGFLLAGLGAEVVRVESGGAAAPGERVLHRGKRSVEDRPALWAQLLAGADAALVDEAGPDLGPAAGLVACRVSAWGPGSDPRRLPPDEALLQAATGVHAMQWAWARRPVWLATPVVSYMTGMLAALGVVAALFARRRGAPGQRVLVDGIGGSLALNSGTYARGPGHQGSLSQEGDPRGVYPNYSLYRARDRWLFVGALTPAFWTSLVTTCERVDLLADERLQGHPFSFGAPAVRDFVRAELDPVFAREPAAAWVERLRAADVPCGVVQTRAEALADGEARALGIVVPLDDPVLGRTWQPGVPAVFSDTPAPAPRAAPLPGADTAAVQAAVASWRRATAPAPAASPRACLAGIGVLDLTSFIAGPVCPMLLAELGAEVVKVESPEGDPFRMAAFAFVGWNRGKRSLVLDLKRPAGREVLLDLVRRADVVVDNFRPGVMERLGLGWETLRATNPRLVHTAVTGYGPEGAALPGFDPIFQARAGLMAAQGGADDPVFHMIAYNDYCAGTLAALATVAALLARERTGRGQRVDVSLFRTSYVAEAAHLASAEVGGRDFQGPSACRRLYACRDGWVCVAAGSEAAAATLARLAGTPVRLEDPPDGPAADAIARVLAREARSAALEHLAAAGVPAAPCLSFDELFTDPHLAARGAFFTAAHPALGPVEQPGAFIHLEATPIVHRRTAPLLGEHGAEVLREAGYDEARIATLVTEGVVRA